MTKEEQLKRAFEICQPGEVVLGFGGTFDPTDALFEGRCITRCDQNAGKITGRLPEYIYLAPANSEVARINWLKALNLKLANEGLPEAPALPEGFERWETVPKGETPKTSTYAFINGSRGWEIRNNSRANNTYCTYLEVIPSCDNDKPEKNFEVGQVWRTRGGLKATITETEAVNDLNQPIVAQIRGIEREFSANGHFLEDNKPSRYDLIELIEEAKPAPVETPKAEYPPVPERWAYYGKGPLKVRPDPCERVDIGGFKKGDETDWDLESGWGGSCYLTHYILRIGSEIAHKNGLSEPEEVKTKTIREWLTELPDGYRELALEAMDEEHADATVKTMRGALFQAFNWDSTPQGCMWWDDVDDHYGYGTPLPPLPETEKPKVEKWAVFRAAPMQDRMEDAITRARHMAKDDDDNGTFYVAKIVTAFKATTTVEEVEI